MGQVNSTYIYTAPTEAANARRRSVNSSARTTPAWKSTQTLHATVSVNVPSRSVRAAGRRVQSFDLIWFGLEKTRSAGFLRRRDAMPAEAGGREEGGRRAAGRGGRVSCRPHTPVQVRGGDICFYPRIPPHTDAAQDTLGVIHSYTHTKQKPTLPYVRTSK
jgi:hypothetical protein